MRRDRTVLSGGTPLLTGASGACYCRRSADFPAYSRCRLPIYRSGFLLFPLSAEGVWGGTGVVSRREYSIKAGRRLREACLGEFSGSETGKLWECGGYFIMCWGRSTSVPNRGLKQKRTNSTPCLWQVFLLGHFPLHRPPTLWVQGKGQRDVQLEGERHYARNATLGHGGGLEQEGKRGGGGGDATVVPSVFRGL